MSHEIKGCLTALVTFHHVSSPFDEKLKPRKERMIRKQFGKSVRQTKRRSLSLFRKSCLVSQSVNYLVEWPVIQLAS